jgi:hypothetical protein
LELAKAVVDLAFLGLLFLAAILADHLHPSESPFGLDAS